MYSESVTMSNTFGSIGTSRGSHTQSINIVAIDEH